MNTKNNEMLGIGLIGVILLAVLFLGNNKGTQRAASMPYKDPGEYNNAETWNVEWSDQGLPIKVTINRHAVQS